MNGRAIRFAYGRQMPGLDEPLDPTSWHRGRSRRRVFPRLRVKHLADVVSALPTEFAPYELVAHELVQHDSQHVSALTAVDVSELNVWVARGVRQYFLVSRTLSKAILDNLPEHGLPSLAVNGAVGVQVEPIGHAGIDFTLSLTAVTLDGSVVHHADYETVFESAVRAARRVSRR